MGRLVVGALCLWCALIIAVTLLCDILRAADCPPSQEQVRYTLTRVAGVWTGKPPVEPCDVPIPGTPCSYRWSYQEWIRRSVMRDGEPDPRQAVVTAVRRVEMVCE